MKQALISVYDKTKIVYFAKELIHHGYEILSTGGTKRELEKHRIPVTGIDEITNTKEMLDGRVKTLHPSIHGALLARRKNDNHMNEIKSRNIKLIDLVCVNLYPFKETIKKENVKEYAAIEQIDIGGSSMLRSAAKNFESVTVVSDVSQYEKVLDELTQHGDTLLKTRKQLAKEVFYKTATYDQCIADYFEEEVLVSDKVIALKFEKTLRYGENPHQKATLYKTEDSSTSLLNAKQIHGKQISYNNLQDADSAVTIIRDFKEPTAVVLKHMNPCGIASSNTVEDAFDKAYDSDPVSIFGGIVAFNYEVTTSLANKLNALFLEIIIAPSFSIEALNILKKKKNIRLLELDTTIPSNNQRLVYRSIDGGMLIQEQDKLMVNTEDVQTVTFLKPSNVQLREALFAWKVVKHVKSNAIVITTNKQTVGIGAGQMNRIEAAKIALKWAKEHGHTTNLILASDAFLPFDDVVKIAHKYGVKTIIQPGGSIRDQQSIDACNQLGIKMIFTNHRHFKH